MIKIVIIDDDMIIRAGMRAIIPWEKYGYVIAGEAGNGEAGLRLINQIKPDIVLTDIVMPEMDGLEMMRAAREQNSSAKFIVLSCMNEIKYYKEAVSLGAKEYVLKNSTSSEEILEIVNRVGAQAKQEQADEFLQDELMVDAEQTIAALICENDLEQKASPLVEDLLKKGRVFVLALKAAGKAMDASKLKSNMIGICRDISGDVGEGCAFLDSDGVVVNVVSYSGESQPRAFLNDFSSRIRKTLIQFLNVSAIFGAGIECTRPDMLAKCHKQARISLSNAVFFGKDLIVWNEAEECIQLKNQKEQIIKSFSLYDSTRIFEEIDVFANKVYELEYYDRKKVIGLLMSVVYHAVDTANAQRVKRYMSRIEGISPAELFANVETFKTMIEKIKSIIEGILKDFSNDITEQSKDSVFIIKSYINDNISERITLESLANAVHLNPQYTSRLFKKETGQNLIDYINKKKIEEAKSLILDKNLISTVIERTGFSSESYFIKVFKEQTGMTPKAYYQHMSKKTGN
jgi:two-component system response regulator YesN